MSVFLKKVFTCTASSDFAFIYFLLSFLSPLCAHFCLLFFFLSFFQQTLAFTASFCYSFNNQITQTHSWPLHLFFPVLGPLSLLLTAWIILSQHLPKSSFSQQLPLTTILNYICPLQLLYFPHYTYYLTYTYIIFVVYCLCLFYN